MKKLTKVFEELNHVSFAVFFLKVYKSFLSFHLFFFVHSYLKYVIFISHFDSPAEFVALSFIENLLDRNFMLLAPARNEK